MISASIVFANRNFKEMLRDVLSWIFCIGLPIMLLCMSKFILSAMPETPQNFLLENFSGGILIFSFSFITLFSGMLVARDRSTSFLKRLYISPMKSSDFIIGYTLSAFPIALAQCVIVYLTAVLFGLNFTLNNLAAIAMSIPSAIMFIGLGIMLGSLFSDKAVSGMASVFVNIAALFSGMWFDLTLIGQAFSDVLHFLPFANAFDVIKFATAGQWNDVWLPFIICLVWTVATYVLSVIVFNKKSKK